MNVKLFAPRGFSANCYALEINNETALIDVGDASEEVLEYVNSNRDKIKYILLTHNHFDHICGVENVLKLTDAKLAMQVLDAENLSNPTYTLTNQVGLPNPKISADLMLSDGDALTLGGETVTLIHTPGHTLGGACYKVCDVIFSGDTLFCGTVGRTDFPGGDYATLLNSLKKLASLQGDYKIYPGHEMATTLRAEIENNPYFRM